jgi:2-methylcitrate dehydratase
MPVLKSSTNQALLLGEFAIDFMKGSNYSIPKTVLHRTKLFHTDSVMCGVSALALKTNAPVILRNEAMQYPASDTGAFVFGSKTLVKPEKAVVANSAAVREWDSNGTVFGYNEKLVKNRAGEFGHNDFYPVVVAAAQSKKLSGADVLRGFVLSDEIRGRLAEVFSLKTYKIDHVVHGGIASVCTYGAMMGATKEQIESAIGMLVAHYIPYRAIRAGKQLSDSKGASAALHAEMAVLSVHRAMNGFLGPKDIFRNPEALFRLNVKTEGDSPFDISLCDDYAVNSMHFKLGLYEHQSAGALQGVVNLLIQNPQISQNIHKIDKITITAYEPAFSIIGDPAKRNPTTRQSADHSMVFIVSRFLKNAFEWAKGNPSQSVSNDQAWKSWMLQPKDYDDEALRCEVTKNLMKKITFVHGGKEFDSKYPEGIPTAIEIQIGESKFNSGLVMYPSGHAKNIDCNLEDILNYKFKVLGELTNMKDWKGFVEKLQNVENLDSNEIQNLYFY